MGRNTFELVVSYSQIAVFDSHVERPFNAWTEAHVKQGFSWRPESASFKTLQDGLHEIEIRVTPTYQSVDPGSIRAIEVPFDVPQDENIEVASISDSIGLSIPEGMYQLRCECLSTDVGADKPKLRLIFMKTKNREFRLIKADSQLSARTLVTMASPA